MSMAVGNNGGRLVGEGGSSSCGVGSLECCNIEKRKGKHKMWLIKGKRDNQMKQ